MSEKIPKLSDRFVTSSIIVTMLIISTFNVVGYSMAVDCYRENDRAKSATDYLWTMLWINVAICGSSLFVLIWPLFFPQRNGSNEVNVSTTKVVQPVNNSTIPLPPPLPVPLAVPAAGVAAPAAGGGWLW